MPDRVARECVVPWRPGSSLRPRADAALDEQEAEVLLDIYAAARDAYAQTAPDKVGGAQRRAIQLEWTRGLKRFLNDK